MTSRIERSLSVASTSNGSIGTQTTSQKMGDKEGGAHLDGHGVG